MDDNNLGIILFTASIFSCRVISLNNLLNFDEFSEIIYDIEQ